MSDINEREHEFEITDMKAGRELDTLIAEKVMEWNLDDYELDGDTYSDRWLVPHYSTNIADAWKVIALAPYYEIATNKYVNKIYVCLRIGETHGSVYADTVEEAICLAALKAVGCNTSWRSE